MENTQNTPELVIFKPEEKGKFAAYIGAELYENISARKHVCVPLEKGGYYLVFYYRDPEAVVEEILGKAARVPPHSGSVRIYVSDECLVFCAADENLSALIASMPQELSPYHRLLDFFLEITTDDIDSLEEIEEILTKLENDILAAKRPEAGVSTRIIGIRHDLIRRKRYYEQLGFILESLSESDRISADPALSRHLLILQRRVAHSLGSVINLREYTTQVREAYQAQIDIEQNEIMKIFTVVAAIFMPLTLLVGWYGMNFHMPEYNWKYGYLALCVFAAIVAAILILIVKRKRWF